MFLPFDSVNSPLIIQTWETMYYIKYALGLGMFITKLFIIKNVFRNRIMVKLIIFLLEEYTNVINIKII